MTQRLFFLFSFLLILFVIFTSSQNSPNHYYNIIENQEKINDTTVIKPEELSELEVCRKTKSPDTCYRQFYFSYTLKNGVENAFSHLALVQKQYPEMLSACHYLSHGIGHASLELNKNNVYKAFGIIQTSTFFKNVATCGNGYFHGVIEEYAKNVKTTDGLVNLLKGVCENNEITNKSACYHGIGHSSVVQFYGDLDKAMYVCNNITNSPEWLFSCRTGAFMEAIGSASVSLKDGIMQFDVCDKQPKEYQSACYMEQSSLFERYTTSPHDYTSNIGFCKQIKDDVNRMSCIKLNAIRATRIVRYNDIKEMCNNTSSKAERVICLAVFASRISSSMALKFNDPVNLKAIDDVCGINGLFDKYNCIDFVINHSDRLFYTSEQDLTLPSLDFGFVKKVLQKEFSLLF